MSLTTAMQPAGLRQGNASPTGEGAACTPQEMADQSQVQKVDEELNVAIALATLLEEAANKLQIESSGEACKEAAEARQQAQLMRTNAEAAKSEIQAARAHARDGKCPISIRKLAAIQTEVSQTIRLGNQEKAELETSRAHYRGETTPVKEKEVKSASPVIRVIKQIAAPVSITSVSTAAVVGPPVFQPPPILSWHTAMQRATHAVTETASVIADSAPVMRVRQLGRAAWENVQQTSSTISDGFSTLVADADKAARELAKSAAEKFDRLGDKALTLVETYTPTPVLKAASAVASGAKWAYQAAGEAKDNVVDYASAKLAGAKKMASNLWPFGEKAPALQAEAAAPKPVPKITASPSKLEALSAMARSLQQAAACRLSLGSACQAASPALALVPAAVPKLTNLTSISDFIAA